MSLALKLVLSPLLVAQAVATRARALVLPEAAGPRAAACGRRAARCACWSPAIRRRRASASRTGNAVAGHIARTLRRRGARPRRMGAARPPGLTTRAGARAAAGRAAAAADVAVVVTGVNDVIDQMPARARCSTGRRSPTGCSSDGWRATSSSRRCRRSAGFRCCHNRCGACWAPTRCATTKRWRAGQRAPECLAPRHRTRPDADTMAEDGFHPGEPVYRACGEALGLHIATTSGRRSTYELTRDPVTTHDPRRRWTSKARRFSSPAHRAASAWRSRCAPRATAPTSWSRRRPPRRIRSCPARSSARPRRSRRPAARRCRCSATSATRTACTTRSRRPSSASAASTSSSTTPARSA